MQLNAANLDQLRGSQEEWPDQSLLNLPEKVLQFGTGVLLRGLPDYFIDKANKQGIFKGRVVVVKSTDRGGTNTFDTQNGLYTLLERGYEAGQKTEKVMVNTAISRVLSAGTQWKDILACAENPEIQIIISNTTEVGITLVTEDATAELPSSYPGKLLAFLQKRYEHFKGNANAGMVILPTELITDNGAKLKAIVTELARLKGTGDGFMNWLHTANDFCSSLVDRIVPGKPVKEEQEKIQQQIGYTDELMIMTEAYRLWAIETDRERTRQILTFATADKGVIIAKDINRYRELKLRLLNGAHTFSCGLACLTGFRLVREAMQNNDFVSYMASLMLEEIAPEVAKGDITREEARAFAIQVLDRFRNPYIDHQWEHIAVEYTSKMAMRNVPLIQAKYGAGKVRNSAMALGFAAYLLYMKPMAAEGGKGFVNAAGMKIKDEKTAQVFEHWNKGKATEETLAGIMADQAIWGTDLTQYPAFVMAVTENYFQLQEQQPLTWIKANISQKTEA